MTVYPISSYKQFKVLLDSNKLFVVDFWATWCGPCRVISPVFERLAEQKEHNEKMDFYSVDVDQHSDIAKEVGIRAMPTFIVFKDGKQLDELRGALSPELEALIMRAADVSDLPAYTSSD